MVHVSSGNNHCPTLLKVYEHNKKVATGIGLAKSIVSGVNSFSDLFVFSDQRTAKTNFLDLFRRHTVPGNMFDNILVPNKLINFQQRSPLWLHTVFTTSHDTYSNMQWVLKSMHYLLIMIIISSCMAFSKRLAWKNFKPEV